MWWAKKLSLKISNVHENGLELISRLTKLKYENMILNAISKNDWYTVYYQLLSRIDFFVDEGILDYKKKELLVITQPIIDKQFTLNEIVNALMLEYKIPIIVETPVKEVPTKEVVIKKKTSTKEKHVNKKHLNWKFGGKSFKRGDSLTKPLPLNNCYPLVWYNTKLYNAPNPKTKNTSIKLIDIYDSSEINTTTDKVYHVIILKTK